MAARTQTVKYFTDTFADETMGLSFRQRTHLEKFVKQIFFFSPRLHLLALAGWLIGRDIMHQPVISQQANTCS